MKHVFWIHSSTAYYMALAVIKELNICDRDLIFLIDRHYHNKYFGQLPLHILCIDFYRWTNILSPFKLKTFFSLNKVIKEIDKVLDFNLKGDKYIAYIPQLTHPIFQIIITHHLCSEYNFIEEGLANYNADLYIKSSTSISNPILIFLLNIFNKFHTRIFLNHAFFGSYKNKSYNPFYYLLANEFHPINKNVHFLFLEKHSIDYLIIKNAPILIMSPTLEYNQAGEVNFYSCIFHLIMKMKEISQSKIVYVKFHPYQNKSVKNKIKVELSEIFNIVEVIPVEEPFEQIILNNDNNLKIFGLDSSLLFYASILSRNSEIYSDILYLSNIDEKYKSIVNTLTHSKIIDKFINIS